MTAEPLYRYYLDSRSKMRNILLPLFPKDLVTMKSGRGFHESCNEVYVKAYREEMSKLKVRGQPKYTEPEVQAMFPPQFWEFTKSPWYFGLAVKIFRRDPQLAPNVAEVMTDPSNVPISRAAMKRNKQLLRHSPKTRSASNPSTATSLLETPRRNDDDDGMLPTTLFSAGQERVSDPSSTKRA